MSQKLQDQVTIVTGCARGIGKAIAERLADDGARLMVCDINKAELEKTAGELRDRGAQVIALAGDLSRAEIIQDVVDDAVAEWGRIDILVNNVGGGVIRPFLEHTPETLKTTIDRNLWSTIWACHKTLPHMVKQNYGRIVNIGADSVRSGLWDHAAYNAAKGGVHGMTTGLAREFARNNITVNTVAPPATATPQLNEMLKADPSLVDKFVSIIPVGRPCEMSEIASMVSYLASREASFVTGQVISVNGGSTML